uniref:Ion_trans_2 domain-containing protein n=1 Tax=Ascaris lumbricoides TaxID=6252 RepID=A0A0M3ITW7_ASCLU
MTIFMIGYGDMGPPIPTVFLVIFIVIGVMLVTISVDVVGANIIHHIHFMGRQMGKARIVAEKMVHMAQKISISKGLGLGVAQLGAFARIGALMHFEQTNNAAIDQKSNQPIIHELKLTTEDVETNSCCSKSVMLAFKPEIDDLDFVDKNMEVITPIRTVLSTNRLSWPSD